MKIFLVEERRDFIFTIRQELKSDYDEVYSLVKASFATTTYSDGTEADYLNAERTKSTFIPELSFVATTETGRIVGQILLYKTNITSQTKLVESLVLSPICVHPEYFHQGIARKMIEHALQKAKTMGYTSVFLCGDPEIYRKLGFRPSYEFGVFHKNDSDAEWCMARELSTNSLSTISGVIDIV
ncbi:GNAT family N-acetyltransferase [Enterococcus sp. HY326]|uniref:GNAT family N-acetyltransferase n=1 Tax=Enterococcus sp. HY326 TaxID=2971265 RepID=UPI002240B360|nr:N-acetyltransferase [Enterococcus sp. HY326]